MLKDSKELWGIPIETIRQLGKKYRVYCFIVYSLDVLLMLFAGIYMFNNGSDFNTCVFATIFISLLSFMILNIIINPEKWRAYLFYKKYRSLKVEEYTLYLNANNIKSILYCVNYKRKKENGTMLEYKDLLLSACREDSIFAKRIGVLLSRFTKNEEDKEEMVVYMLNKGKKYFLVGIKDDSSE